MLAAPKHGGRRVPLQSNAIEFHLDSTDETVQSSRPDDPQKPSFGWVTSPGSNDPRVFRRCRSDGWAGIVRNDAGYWGKRFEHPPSADSICLESVIRTPPGQRGRNDGECRGLEGDALERIGRLSTTK